jgi:hypothetical protein
MTKTLPNHVAVRSRFIEAIGYDDDTVEMLVLFKNKSCTAYSCPRTHYENMVAENNNPDGKVGGYFANNIRSGGESKFSERSVLI